jgi:hypothetical protein
MVHAFFSLLPRADPDRHHLIITWTMLRPEHGRLPGALTEGRGIRRTTLYSRPERPIRRLILHSPHWRPRFHYRFPPTERGYSGRLPPSGSRLFCGRNVRNHPVPSHLTDTNAGSVRSQQQPLRSNRSRTYKSALHVHPTGIPGIWTVLAYLIAGAFCRSESALAFTTCSLRQSWHR